MKKVLLSDLSRGILSEPDPLAVWEEALSFISDQDLINKKFKILLPACGQCSEAKVLIQRMKSLGLASDDIRSRFYLIDTDGFAIINAIRNFGFDPNQVYHADFLTWSPPVSGMKFDAVIGNPPYDKNSGAKNTKLWAKFSTKALELSCGYVAFITPNNAVSNKGINGELLRKQINDSGFGFMHVKNHGNTVFKGVGVETCHWIVCKGSQNLVDPVVVKYDLSVNDLQESIINKVINSSFPKLPIKHENYTISKNDLSQTGTAIYFSGDKQKYTQKPVTSSGVLKLVIPFSASYHKMFVTSDATGMLNANLPIASTSEADVLMSYLKSKLFKFVAQKYKKTSGFTPLVRSSMIPDIRRDKIYTDDEVYQTFGITEEEIDFIENNT
jgi:hypothetical protein